MDEVEDAVQGIKDGIELTDSEARHSGVVFLESFFCSGTLLNSKWVLTAAHCVSRFVDQPNAMWIRFGNRLDPSAERRNSIRIILNPNGSDTALIELSSHAPSIAPPAGRYSNNRILFFGMDDNKLINVTAKSIGYGMDESYLSDSIGTLRYGRLRINSVSSSGHLIVNSDGPLSGLPGKADSGSPLLLEVWGTNSAKQGSIIATYLAGVANTPDQYAGPSQFRAWVESTVFGTPSSRIDCKSTSCISTPQPLPNSTWAHQGFSPYSASSDECYFAKASFNFEQNKDFFTMGNGRVSGNGAFGTHWCGVLPLSLTTNGSVSSKGLSAISLSNRTKKTTPESSQCAGVTGGYKGCRGTGCHACIEALNAYPKYFKNHPKCIPNTTCGSYATGLCSANCPAPTSRDR